MSSTDAKRYWVYLTDDVRDKLRTAASLSPEKELQAYVRARLEDLAAGRLQPPSSTVVSEEMVMMAIPRKHAGTVGVFLREVLLKYDLTPSQLVDELRAIVPSEKPKLVRNDTE